jgi:hypothetical protein
MTARDYVWEKVIQQLLLRVEFAAALQAVTLPDIEEPAGKPARSRAARPAATRGIARG